MDLDTDLERISAALVKIHVEDFIPVLVCKYPGEFQR
jgi:hypothetical protein